jgi:hypothetical protein
MIECLFNKKILTVQTDWGGGYQKLNTFFSMLVLFIKFLAHMLINKMAPLSASIAI